MQSRGQRYCLMMDSEGFVALSEGATFLETLDLVNDVPIETVSVYFTRYRTYGRVLNARRIAGTFLDGLSKTMVHLRGMRHDTDIGTRERRWLSKCQWYAGTFSSAERLIMAFVGHVGEGVYVYCLYALL